MGLPETAKKMIWIIAAAAVVFIAAGAAYYRSPEALAFAFGVVLVSGLNVMKVFMLQSAVRSATEMDENKEAKNYIRGQYLLRYFLTAGVLIVAALTDYINLWGAIAGILTWQIAAHCLRLFVKPEKFPPKSMIPEEEADPENRNTEA